MSLSKIRREREALIKAESELKDRRAKVAQMERQERQKQLAKAIKKVGEDAAVDLLLQAAKIGPDEALKRLAA